MLRRPRARTLLATFAGVLAVRCLAFPTSASGTVEEQRARLPPPAECSDAVEGVWMSLSFSRGEWYDFTLTIRRTAPESDQLRGDIIAHYWGGTDQDVKPPPCGNDGLELVVKMPAKGKLDPEGRVEFGGTSWTLDRVVCGRPTGYNPDQFAGRIDPAIQEFQSLNNDGGRFVNEPTVFRRVKCLDAPRKQPPAAVKPPAYAPARRSSGCGL
jgi:hypothetical protein